MDHPDLTGGEGRAYPVQSAAMAGWTPRAAPASPPYPVLETEGACTFNQVRSLAPHPSAPVGALALTPYYAGHVRARMVTVQ